jgi:hypothetical protein
VLRRSAGEQKFCFALTSDRVQVKCGYCGSASDKDSSVTESEQYPIPKSRGQAHLVQKVCKRNTFVSLLHVPTKLI